jgi:hypothetical protein
MQAKTDAASPVRKAAKKKKPLRAAFVVTAAMAVTGCESSVKDDTDGNGGNDPCEVESCNPPVVECPNGIPGQGTPCDWDVDTCSYTDECGSPVEASCVDGEWNVEIATCNPPPPGECPANPPAEGDDCDPEQDNTCDYTDDCGVAYQASCNGATWEVEVPPPCNPPPCPPALPAENEACELAGLVGCVYDVETACGPAQASASCLEDENLGLVWSITAPPCTPPEPNCYNYTDAALCDADTTCRWLVPGCDDGPSFPASCLPALECDLAPNDNCGEFQECVVLNHDPCWNSSCGACSADTTACLPVFDKD